MPPLVTALLNLASPHRRALLLGTALNVAESAFALALPLLAGALASALLAGDRPQAPTMLAALAGVLTAQAALRFAANWVLGRAGHALQAGLRGQLYDHLLRLPLPWFHARSRGDVLSVVTVDTWRVSQFVTSTLTALAGVSLTLTGAVLVMARIDLRLALLCALLVPLFWLAIKVIGRRVRPLAHAASEAEWRCTSQADESLSLVTEIKAFVREARESQRFADLNAHWRALSDAQLGHASALPVLVQWLAGMAVVGLFWFASRTPDAGSAAALGPGAMISFLLYAALLARPVGALAELYGQTQTARAALGRVVAILEAVPEGGALTGAHVADDARRSPPRIEFRDVSFAHPGRAPCLRSFNLNIEPGEVVALTGPNGAGKSTVVQLLMGFASLGDVDVCQMHDNPADTTKAPPERAGAPHTVSRANNIGPAAPIFPPAQVGTGTILLQGRNIVDIDPKILRGWVGYVPQHTALCSGTVRDNIAFGRPDAGDEAVARAARLAGAEAFILELPAGYDTAVGELGVRLSGGQRQRIALARALLLDPAILILDEATSMFDSATERHFFELTLPQIARGRTVLLVVHGEPTRWAAARQVALTVPTREAAP